jgi:hypothetical protein
VGVPVGTLDALLILPNPSTPTPAIKKTPQKGGLNDWRSRWDLNPRWTFTHTTFRELHLRPLGHGTVG